MLVAANVFTTQIDKLVARWKLEGGLPRVPGQKVNIAFASGTQGTPAEVPVHWPKENYRIPPDGELGPACTGDTQYAGTFVVYDWDSKEIIWQSDWDGMVVTPAGFCFADGVMYINDVEGANIFVVDVDRHPGRLTRRISHPYLNDLHSIERTDRGLLVTCSGTDLILELDLQGNALYEWWACDHGYDKTPSGKTRVAGKGQEHRDQYYHTRYHTTHLNDACFRDSGERFLLSLLFHQGQLIEIDRQKPPEQQQAKILLDGLVRPHGLERNALGWLLCNSLSKELLILDDDFKIADRIAYDGGWIQDCTMLANGRILLNDVDNHRLVEHAGPPWEITSVTKYPDSWRMGELLEVPTKYEAGFRGAAKIASKP